MERGGERERERHTNANWFSSVHCGPRAFNLMLEFVFVKKYAHAVKAASLFYYLQTRIVSNGNRKRSRSIGTVGDLVPVDSTASCNRKTFPLPPLPLFLLLFFFSFFFPLFSFFFRKRARVHAVINRKPPTIDKTKKLNESRGKGLRDPR